MMNQFPARHRLEKYKVQARLVSSLLKLFYKGRNILPPKLHPISHWQQCMGQEHIVKKFVLSRTNLYFCNSSNHKIGKYYSSILRYSLNGVPNVGIRFYHLMVAATVVPKISLTQRKILNSLHMMYAIFIKRKCTKQRKILNIRRPNLFRHRRDTQNKLQLLKNIFTLLKQQQTSLSC